MIWPRPIYFFFFFNDPATTEIYPLSLHDPLPISFWVPLPEHSYTPRWPDHSAAGLHELQRSHNEPTLSWEQPALVGSSIRRKSEEHTSELQSRSDLVCRLLLEKKKHTRHYT